jgi:hypothetical protein
MLFQKHMDQFIGSATFVDEIAVYKTDIYVLWHGQCIGQGILDHEVTVFELFQELLEHIGENKCDIKLSHYGDLYNIGGEWYAGESSAKVIRVGENHDMDKVKIGQIVRLLSNNPCQPKIVDTWYLEAGEPFDSSFKCESIEIRIHEMD